MYFVQLDHSYTATAPISTTDQLRIDDLQSTIRCLQAQLNQLSSNVCCIIFMMEVFHCFTVLV